MAQIKICGLKREIDVEASITYGASWSGYIFYDKSIRNINLDQAKIFNSIAKNRIGKVAVFVNPSLNLIKNATQTLKPDLIQLHGDETPQRCQKIYKMTGIRIIKAINLESESDLVKYRKYIGNVFGFLFDSKLSKEKLEGRKGKSFDWKLLKDFNEDFDWILAGGLKPGNVINAMRTTNAKTVDVSSGVEKSPGIKCHSLIKNFIKNANSISL